MSRVKKRSWKNILLNTLAVCLTITPIFSVGAWAFTTIKGDDRKLIELASVESASAPKLFEEPLVSVTFDDGWETVYTNGGPIMSKYNIASTQYILPGQFTAPAYLSLKQAKHMGEIGHEIASHTYEHSNLTKVNQKTMLRELDLSHKLLIDNKLVKDRVNFAPPNGAYNSGITAEVKKLYHSQRNVAGNLADGVDDTDVNLKKGFNRYDIIGYTVGPYTTMKQLEQAIEFAIENNGWLVLVYHQLEPDYEPEEGEPSYNVTPKEFEQHMKLLIGSKVKLATVHEIMKGYKNDK